MKKKRSTLFAVPKKDEPPPTHVGREDLLEFNVCLERIGRIEAEREVLAARHASLNLDLLSAQAARAGVGARISERYALTEQDIFNRETGAITRKGEMT